MTGFAETESGLSYLLKVLRQYEYPSVFLFVVLAAIVMIVIFGKRKGRMLFVYPLLLIGLTVLNPYVFPSLISVRSGLHADFYRALWLIPLSMITACGAVSLARFLKSKAAGAIVLVLFLAAVLVTGSTDFGRFQVFNQSMNVWGAENDLIQAADAIRRDSDLESVLVGTETETLAEDLRAYDVDFRCMILTDPAVLTGQKQSDSVTEIPEYCILEKGGEMLQSVQQQDLSVIFETDRYLVCKIE